MVTTKFYSLRFAWMAAATACLLNVSCNDDDQPEPEPEQTGILVKTDASFGSILTDSVGQVLYVFSKDADGNSACAGNCLSLWPKYYSSHAASSEGIESDDIGTVVLADGSLQTTYKGWPLYYYANDEAPGDVQGDGVGGNWFVAKPDYSVLLVQNQLVGGDGTAYKADLTPGEGMTYYLVDAYGRTLYGFVNDRYNTNNFTKPDFSNDAVWPIYESAALSVPSTLNAEDFAEITVHGRMQLTYKGWPLYYFGSDAARGETKGIDFPKLGIWPVLNAESPEATAP
ncbi:hypothetical protein [Parapedobacter indicus]|uniref:Lipoprotein with Yx(FWY)xxD motif n=1 Tax=Parapedobacter indicus TaxID=1477437 RepID=A0A1I3F652_9SPHI|nr:hypothetical protein [Parapedobacter indicus]PPL03579.1 secreted repeat protein with Y-X4-D motif [Parapedobacter indicus]SFI06697.1 Secreted repeat of unknown function [Parapedobacter indicus]